MLTSAASSPRITATRSGSPPCRAIALASGPSAACAEQTPRTARSGGWSGTGLLGFQLAASGTAGTLASWQIAVDEPELLVLETDSRLMAGRMVFEACDTVTWTTMLRYHRPAARPIWAAAKHAHRALTPRCLEAARQSLQRSTPDPDTASGERDRAG
jgi:hypothetical protein